MRVLVAESADFPPGAMRLLESAACVTWADLDSAALPAAVEGHDVLWVRLRSRIGRDLMAAAPGLLAIATPTTGLTHIDVAAAGERGIEVLCLRGETEFLRSIRATAEMTIGLMLTLLRRLPDAMDHALNGNWNRDLFRGRELNGSTVGIVGLGRLGQQVARYLNAFGARVLAYDPYVATDSLPPGVQLGSMELLLEEADLVSLHVSLTPETTRFFGQAQFERMRQGSLFINTARGEVTDEAALLAALDGGRLGGAAIDVIAAEHVLSRDHPLLVYAREHRNLLITPHIGGCTTNSMELTEVFLAGKLCRWMKARESNR